MRCRPCTCPSIRRSRPQRLGLRLSSFEHAVYPQGVECPPGRAACQTWAQPAGGALAESGTGEARPGCGAGGFAVHVHRQRRRRAERHPAGAAARRPRGMREMGAAIDRRAATAGARGVRDRRARPGRGGRRRDRRRARSSSRRRSTRRWPRPPLLSRPAHATRAVDLDARPARARARRASRRSRCTIRQRCHAGRRRRPRGGPPRRRSRRRPHRRRSVACRPATRRARDRTARPTPCTSASDGRGSVSGQARGSAHASRPRPVSTAPIDRGSVPPSRVTPLTTSFSGAVAADGDDELGARRRRRPGRDRWRCAVPVVAAQSNDEADRAEARRAGSCHAPLGPAAARRRVDDDDRARHSKSEGCAVGDPRARASPRRGGFLPPRRALVSAAPARAVAASIPSGARCARPA